MCYPTTILIEIPPTQGKIYNKEQSIVYSLLHRWFTLADYNVVDVSPGQWKGFVKKETLSITHIQDASGIARWFHRSIQNEQH